MCLQVARPILLHAKGLSDGDARLERGRERWMQRADLVVRAGWQEGRHAKGEEDGEQWNEGAASGTAGGQGSIIERTRCARILHARCNG